MGEPIILHDANGNTYTVYARSQAETLLRGGQWYATEAEATAATAKAGKGGATVTEPVVEPAPPAPAKPTPRRGKA